MHDSTISIQGCWVTIFFLNPKLKHQSIVESSLVTTNLHNHTQDVQEHLPIRIPLDHVLDREQTTPDLGQEGASSRRRFAVALLLVFPLPSAASFFFELPNLRTFSDRTTTAVAFTL